MDGHGDFLMQARQAADSGGGTPSMKPGRGDRRAVLLLSAFVVTLLVALAFFG
jgi:hypothetical protein